MTVYFIFIHRYNILTEIRNILNKHGYTEIIEVNNKMLSYPKYKAKQMWDSNKFTIFLFMLISGIIPKYLQMIYNWPDQMTNLIITCLFAVGGISCIVLYFNYLFKK